MKYECNRRSFGPVTLDHCGTIYSLDFIINLEAKLTASCYFFIFLSSTTERDDWLLHVNYQQAISWLYQPPTVTIANPGAG